MKINLLRLDVKCVKNTKKEEKIIKKTLDKKVCKFSEFIC